MSDDEVSAMEEFISAHRYICSRIEFFQAALAWLCEGGSEDDVCLAHQCLYTGMWCDTQPADESWPVNVFQRQSKVVN